MKKESIAIPRQCICDRNNFATETTNAIAKFLPETKEKVALCATFS
jgi:hypothetical protein